MQNMNFNSGVLSVFALLSTVVEANTVYCQGDQCWVSNGWNCDTVCYRSGYNYGYYCCDDWYGDGWAVALWIILSLILIVCCVWCCIAAAADPRPIYTEPYVEVVAVKTKQSTQPQTVKSQTGYTKQLSGGNYTVQGQPASAPPVQQGYPAQVMQAPAPVQAVPQGQPVVQKTTTTTTTTYPNLSAPRTQGSNVGFV